MTETGTVTWFDLDKKFGFLALGGGKEAFLHMSVLKAAGYVWVPRGTTMQVRVETDRGKPRVSEVFEVDPTLVAEGRNGVWANHDVSAMLYAFRSDRGAPKPCFKARRQYGSSSRTGSIGN